MLVFVAKRCRGAAVVDAGLKVHLPRGGLLAVFAEVHPMQGDLDFGVTRHAIFSGRPSAPLDPRKLKRPGPSTSMHLHKLVPGGLIRLAGHG